MSIVPGKSPTFIYYFPNGKEMERVPCEGKSVEELADDLAIHGIYPKGHTAGGSTTVGHLDLLAEEREEM